MSSPLLSFCCVDTPSTNWQKMMRKWHWWISPHWRPSPRCISKFLCMLRLVCFFVLFCVCVGSGRSGVTEFGVSDSVLLLFATLNSYRMNMLNTNKYYALPQLSSGAGNIEQARRNGGKSNILLACFLCACCRKFKPLIRIYWINVKHTNFILT